VEKLWVLASILVYKLWEHRGVGLARNVPEIRLPPGILAQVQIIRRV
jgi:hypothetical protein